MLWRQSCRAAPDRGGEAGSALRGSVTDVVLMESEGDEGPGASAGRAGRATPADYRRLRSRKAPAGLTRHDAHMSDPLAGSPWSATSTVAGFATSPPNETLLAFAAVEQRRVPGGRAIDIGCGAGRNAVPLARQGWQVLGTDLSRPMLAAAIARHAAEAPAAQAHFAMAPMDALPGPGRAFDLVVAHGIWNLARSAAEFRRAVDEAARVAAPGAALFVFTFSRHTLPPDVAPVSGEPFVFTQFSGQPQCFVTYGQLLDELGRVGFVPDATLPVTEHNLPPPGQAPAVRVPVIFEAAFRYRPRPDQRSDSRATERPDR